MKEKNSHMLGRLDPKIKQSTRRLLIPIIIMAMLVLPICANLVITNNAAYGEGGGTAGTLPINPPPSGGGCGDNCAPADVAPYWVYFRIKNYKKTSFTVAGETVSGCNGAGGFYFQFNKNLSAAQSTVMNAGTSRMYYIDHSSKKTVPTDKYNSTDLEPIYLTFHSDGKDYTKKGEINICSLTTPRKKVNDNKTYSSSKVVGLKVGDSLLQDKCNYNRDYVYDYKTGSSHKDHELICKGPKLCWSWDVESDIVSYIVDQWDYMIGKNKNAVDSDGNSMYGKKIWDTQRNADPGNVVNVVWFCGGFGSGEYQGTTTGKIGKTQKSVTTSGTENIAYNGTKTDGKYTINFEHLLKRTDNKNDSVPTQTVKIITKITDLSTNESTTETEDVIVSLEKKGTTGKDSVTTKKSVSVTLSPGQKKKVCQTMQYYSFVDYSYQTGNFLTNSDYTKKTTVCVTITQPIFLSPGSASYVTNGVNSNSNSPVLTGGTNTIQGLAGSKGGNKVYSYTFTHKLKLEGKTGYAYDIEYYIVQTKNGTTQTIEDSGTASSPKTQRVNSGSGSYVQVSYTAGSWDAIGPGQQTPTICQTIYFRPKQISAGSSYTVTDNSWQSSTVCTNVKRSAPKPISVSATSKVTVNGVENPTDIQISVEPVKIIFSFNTTTTGKRNLTTNYSVERLIYSSGETKNWNNATVVKGPASINANGATITDSFKKAAEDGQSLIVCERIRLEPYQFQIEYKGDGKTEDGVTSLSGSKTFAERCVTLGRPQKEVLDDGEITVYSSSEGRLDNSNYDSSLGAYVIKKEQENIIYTHKLWRKAETHTRSGSSVTSPAENVVVAYRLDDPSATYNSTSIYQRTGANTNLPTITVATNTESKKQTLTSNQSSPLLNANTVATAGNVGVPTEYCQSIYFISKQYTLRGEYYMLNGQVWNTGSGKPQMLSVKTPVSKDVVGKSSPACVKVVRPYNFKVNKISVESSPDTATSESDISVSFRINVTKNDNANEYKITDVPSANIRVLKLTITEPLTSSDSTAGGIASDPCQHFTSALGAKASCNIADSYTRTVTPNGVNSSSNASYYPTSNEYNSLYSYTTTLSSAPTTYKICYAIAINPTNSGSKGYGTTTGDFDTSRWVVSDAACINIGKRPTVQVWGGSVFSSGGIHTTSSRARANGELRTFGSWADYMIVANDTNKNMASGATLISGMTNATACKYSPLTIANSKCNADTKELGKAAIESAQSLERGIYEYYLKNNKDKYLDLKTTALKNGSHVVTRNTLNDASGTYPIFIYNNDDAHSSLYIEENIDVGFSGRTYSDINIPQVIIYTPGNIYISPQVTRIDAWVIAGGEIRTCADAKGTVIRTQEGRVDECDSALTITGPVYAKKILLDRTSNGDIQTNESGSNSITEPAELIDLSPATYLFGYNESTNNAQPAVTYMHKLPVRY